MSTSTSVFDYEIPLPDQRFTEREPSLLGFADRFGRINRQLELLLRASEIEEWSKRLYKKQVLPLCSLIKDQYPLAIFHGDVGTGKTTVAEGMANRIVADSRTEDSILYKLSNRVRGSGKVGEMGTLLAEAFRKIHEGAGKKRRAILIIDEADSVASVRSQDQSHHEDKVGVNTLIQGIDSLRTFGGRIVVILCTNRLSVVDPAVLRRAAVVEEFRRPTDRERHDLFEMDLHGLAFSRDQVSELVRITGPKDDLPPWTFSDLRTRLYPAALSRAFPDRAITFDDFKQSVKVMKPSPVLEDK